MTDTTEWQGRVGQSWASEWQRTDRSFGALTAELRRRLMALDYGNVLDIGCGAGELSLAAAQIRPEATVTGLDISPDLISIANERGVGFPGLRFQLGDASQWRPEDGSAPDLLISRHGVMFFSNPVAAFSSLRALASPDARLLFSCFRTVADNSFFRDIARLLPVSDGPPADPFAPGPFAFADESRVASILTEAGWQDLRFERYDFRMVAGAGDNPVDDAVGYFSRIGPAARAMANMDEIARQQFRATLARFLPDHVYDGEVSLPASVWIVTGRNA